MVRHCHVNTTTKKPSTNMVRLFIGWLILVPAIIGLLGATLGFAIEYFAPYKTMRIQLLWAFIPTALLMIYASLLGAIILHKITDRLYGLQKH